ncbi:MAG: TolC family protein [Polyangiaceae bacterium]
MPLPLFAQTADVPSFTAPLPNAPVVEDRMLAAIPAAPQELASWKSALDLVRSRSTDLGTVYAQVRAAEAQARTALAAVLPTINASATVPHHFITRETGTVIGTGGGAGSSVRPITTPQSDYLSFNAQLQQSVINVQAWQNISLQKDNVAAAKLSAEDTQRVIALSVATAMVGVVAAERVAEVNRIGLRTALERRELTARKRALGVGTGLDLVRADQDVAQARATIVTANEALRKSREALGLAVGIPSAVGVTRSLKLDDVFDGASRSCPHVDTLEGRPDVMASKKKAEVAERTIRNVQLSFLPTLSASSSFQTTTADTGAALPSTWSVSATLSIPIWDGGAKYGTLRNARAARDVSGFQLEALRRSVTVQLAQANRNVDVAVEALGVAKESRDLASQVDQLTQTQYRAGQGTSLELVVAAAALRQAEITLALREFDVVTARLQSLFALARCSGTP